MFIIVALSSSEYVASAFDRTIVLRSWMLDQFVDFDQAAAPHQFTPQAARLGQPDAAWIGDLAIRLTVGFGNRENFERVARFDLHSRWKIDVQMEVFMLALEMNHTIAFQDSLTAIPEPYCSGNQRQQR